MGNKKSTAVAKSETQEDQLKLAIQSIEKDYGPGSVMTFDSGSLPDVQFISSGCLTLDIALGGGFPRGRIVEIYGHPAAGKTTLALHIIANALRDGGHAAFVDAEHSLDLQYAVALGLDPSRMLISQPNSGEQALGIVERFVRSGAISVVVVDSVAALTPAAEVEGEIGDTRVGLQARLMSQAMRKLTSVAHNTNTLIVFINQIRMKIIAYGNPEETCGGQALKFYAAQRLELKRGELIKTDEIATSGVIRAKVVKNKVAMPFRNCEFRIKFGQGVDSAYDLLQHAVTAGLIEKAGSWYSLDGDKIAQGEDAAATWLSSQPDTFTTLYDKLYKKLITR